MLIKPMFKHAKNSLEDLAVKEEKFWGYVNSSIKNVELFVKLK